MIQPSRRLVVFASLFSLGAAALQAQPSRVTARIDNGSTVVLTGRVHAQANARNDRGAVEGAFAMPGMMLLLKPSAAQQSALGQLLQRQQDPSSPDFHRWLTPWQYAAQFGASPDDVTKITDWLQSQGFVVDNIASSHTWIAFSGSAAQVSGAFHTSIHRYDVGGVTHYANATDPAIPAALADVVTGVRGLHDFRLKPRARKATPEMTTSSGVHHIVPDDLATIYNIAHLYTDGLDGTGQTIAVVGQSNINISDATTFRANFHLSAPNVTKVLAGPNPGIVSGDVDESNLDIEWSGAVARNAQILFYYSTDVWTSALYAIDHNQAKVLTMSYGSCEQSDLVDLPTFQAAAQQANAQGMTFLAASGDNGAADCEDSGAVIAQDGLAVDVPGSIPEVTSAGGTEFQEQSGITYWSATNTANGASALQYIPEIAWNDTSLEGNLASTGGGASVFFPQPSWQTGAGVPADGKRHVPDVSLASSPAHDAYYVYSSGSAQYFGGTSFAAPTWAGLVALLNQYLVNSGIQSQSGLGNINPTLYRLAAIGGVFHDITSGSNIVPCVPGSPDCSQNSGGFTLGYFAGPNYDQATGLGSMNAYNLVHQWGSNLAQNAAVAATIDNNPVFQVGSQWPFTITLNEEAGIAATLTSFTINGVSHLSQFSNRTMAARGSISATINLTNVAVPTNVVFVFGGVDASGATKVNIRKLPMWA